MYAVSAQRCRRITVSFQAGKYSTEGQGNMQVKRKVKPSFCDVISKLRCQLFVNTQGACI